MKNRNENSSLLPKHEMFALKPPAWEGEIKYTQNMHVT